MSLNHPKKRTGGSKKDDFEYDPVGDPISPEGVPSSGLARVCDVIYYILMLVVVVTTLILVILLAIWVCDIWNDTNNIIECLDFIKGKVSWIHDVVDEQRMILDYQCDDQNECTLDFSKQGGCMSLPFTCQPQISKKKDGTHVVVASKNNKERTECSPQECHDKCFDDTAPPTPPPTPLPMRRRSNNGLLKRTGNGPNGQCSLGVCEADTDCKGTCDPSLTLAPTAPPVPYRKRGKAILKNGEYPTPPPPTPKPTPPSCVVHGCPSVEEINFKQQFTSFVDCDCSDCHVCQYKVSIGLGFDQSFHDPPLACRDTKLLKKKCMAAIEHDSYLKSCIVATVDSCELKSPEKRNQPVGREWEPEPVKLKCRYHFACAKPWVNPFLII